MLKNRKVVILYINSLVNGARTIGSYEVLGIKKSFERLGYDVDIVGRLPKKGQNTHNIVDIFEADLNNYDHVIVENIVINFFGGVKNDNLIKAYELMSKYEGKLYYFLHDLAIPFQQLWPHVEHRGWNINKDNVWIDDKKVVVVSQGSDLIKAFDVHKKFIPTIDKFLYYPIERYILLDSLDSNYFNDNPEFDLVYGGTWRSGSRKDKMKEYFESDLYKTYLFGTISNKHLQHENITFGKKVQANMIIEENSKAYACLVLGESKYNDNMITLRVWESLLSGAIAFIDSDFDTNRTILKNDYFYVSSSKELASKINDIKNDEDLRVKLLDEQMQYVKNNYDLNVWLEGLNNIFN